MFTGLLATTISNVDDFSSDIRASPLSPSCTCVTSASSSAGGNSGDHQNRQLICGDKDSYPLASHCSPLADTAYSSPHTDGRPRRPGSCEYLTPFSATGGDASPATTMANQSSDRPGRHSSPLVSASMSPSQKACGEASTNGLDHANLTSSSPLSIPDQNNRAPSSPSSTPTPVLEDPGKNMSSGVSSTTPPRASTVLDKNGASPALVNMESNIDAEKYIVMRSGTRECKLRRPRSPPLLSPLLASSSTPCEPPLEGPPVSTRRPSVGESPPSPLRYSIFYTEEGHRVQLETRETEERRCLYHAHKAVLSVYRMWAAEGSDRGYSDDDTLQLTFPRRGNVMSRRFLDSFHTSAPNTLSGSPGNQRAPPSSAMATNTVAADRVSSFLNSSVIGARGRRSGGANQESRTAGSVLAHQFKKPSSTHIGCDADARRSSPDQQHRLRGSHTSSPPTSRILDYSSMQMAETASPFVCTSGEPSSMRSRARLFSPWRTPRIDKYSGVTRRAGGMACAHVEGNANRDDRHGRPQKGSRTPLVPHVVCTSPLTTGRLSFASASLRSSSAALRRQGWPEWRDTVPPAAGIASIDRASSSLCALSPSVSRGFSLQCTAQKGRRGSSQVASSPVRNASVSLVSATTASRHISLATGIHPTETRVAGDPARYAPNEASRCQQLPVKLGTRGNNLLRSPRNNVATNRRTSLVAQRIESRRREGFNSYGQYKRFFDAVYNEPRASSPFLRESDARQSTAKRTSPVFKRTLQTPASSSFNGVSGDTYAGSWLRRSPISSSQYRRVRSPAPVACRDVRAPFSYESKGAVRTTLPPSETTITSFAWLSDRVASLRGGDNGGATQWASSGEAALFAARLTRLSTLEKLCRAELQRRWMEDQSVLLHHFILEGTATLQRDRRLIVAPNSRTLLNSGNPTEARQSASK
ncbi:hypothetical protein JKF63_00063 [Porcisia hertigi]|uniref:Uncharacterized protein n=1 Tax=Porcisia hertigi TaxID=2761500 RepID=A0A836HSY2_9TRYP|nr:hypothetical protein JKF63_00063 [Porcisia hertigi]